MTPDKIVSSLTSTHSAYQLLYEMNCQQFFKLEWPFTKKSGENWFIFKLEQPTNTTITVDKQTIELFYGKLYSLKQKDKPLGFLISLPAMEHKTHEDILISSPKNTNVEDLDDNAEVLLTTEKLSVFLLDDTVQYIAGRSQNIQSQFT